MPRKSQAQLTIEALEGEVIASLRRILADPNSSTYSRTRATGTLRGIAKEAKRQLAKQQAATKPKRDVRTAGKAEAAQAEMLANWLPDNGRRIVGHVPAATVADASTWPDLDVINAD
jgi:hypothetical protein